MAGWMTSRLATAFLAAAVLAGGALAATGDPQRHLNVADQAWARSIRIERTDLPGSGWQVRRPRKAALSPECRPPAESDLVETGSAGVREFVKPGSFASSDAVVFASAAHARTAWERARRRPVVRCLSKALRLMFSAPGARVTVLSGGTLRVAALAPRSAGYRVRFALTGPEGRYEGRLDSYSLARGRAVGGLEVMSFTRPVEPVSSAAERRLAALVAGRLRR
jgi:hypothetical protein